LGTRDRDSPVVQAHREGPPDHSGTGGSGMGLNDS
jgi:hypothetical protein